MTDFSLSGIEIGQSLGSGSTGDVYAASDTAEEGGEFVLKRYRSISIDRNFLDENFRQMEAMPAHDNLAGIRDYQLNESPYFSLTEKAPGESLGEIGSLKEAEAWNLIKQISEAMGHAHKFGPVHGNLHPGNIFYQYSKPSEESEKEELEITVTDFGAGMIGEVHHIDLDENTFFFAPEQLESDGRGWKGGGAKRWDVYSFGVVAYCLINGALPRGQEYLKDRRKALAKSGGRPVPVDPIAYIESVRNSPEVRWSKKLGVTREQKQFRGIIEGCLALDPSKRPVDLREVRNRFLALKNQYALENAEDRVAKEKLMQKAKLFGARAVAGALGLFFLLATFYLVDFFKKSYFFKNKVNELDQVVTTQLVHIDNLDRNWTDTKTDLKNSREAADTFFSTMAHGDNAGGSGVASLKNGELEKSRKYYLKTLENVTLQEGACVERARALHSLAHIERKLKNKSKSLSYFRDAVVSLKESLEDSEDQEIVRDLHLRLADSYENTSQLLDHPMSDEALEVLRSAVEHFGQVLKARPDDASVVLRQAGTNFRLGKAYDAHREYDNAIAAYSKSASLAADLRKNSPESKALSDLLGKLQFQVAKSLRMAERIDEAISAQIASMETLETLKGINGYSPVQAIQMSESFLELGELFSSKEDATPGDLDQLYNESLRLLTPLNTENPMDVDVAVLLCRSLNHLGLIENEAGQWTAGYRLSVRGIETLKKSLGEKPTAIQGIMVLAEARIEHLKFLDSEKSAAKTVALRGVETAVMAQIALENQPEVVEPVRSQLHQRLSKIFRNYGDVCKSLGEMEHSNRCYTQASKSLTYIDQESQAKL